MFSPRPTLYACVLMAVGGWALFAVASEESEWTFVSGSCVYRHLLFPNGANFTFRNPCEMVICDVRNKMVLFKRCPTVSCPHCDERCRFISLKGSYPHCCRQVICDKRAEDEINLS
ncbi:uncharacterized protein LOC144159847 [Haemaphysalis longicornis]